jgi:hypothetical protein
MFRRLIASASKSHLGRAPGHPMVRSRVTTMLPALILCFAPACAQTDINLWFGDAEDTTQIFYSTGPTFYVIVETDSGDSARIDTVAVGLSTEQGDRETCRAVETGPASNRFVAVVKMAGLRSAPVPDNGVLEVDGSSLDGETVVLVGTVDLGDGPETAGMDLGLPGGDGVLPRARARRAVRGEDAETLHSVDGRRIQPRRAASSVRTVSIWSGGRK